MSSTMDEKSKLIKQFLEMIIDPDGVFEIRIPKAGREKTVSGYYNRDNLDNAVKDILDYEGRFNIYVTLNPVNPVLLARAANRLKPFAEHTTSDSDILIRKWLLIDIDPIRPSGVSSSVEEKKSAFEIAEDIMKYLLEREWAEPLFCDSGNGYHLLYMVDMCNDEKLTEDVKNALKALADMFDNSKAKVDTGVSNASRITKVIGTTACKGDNLPDRPHRVSRILRIPEHKEKGDINEDSDSRTVKGIGC